MSSRSPWGGPTATCALVADGVGYGTSSCSRRCWRSIPSAIVTDVGVQVAELDSGGPYIGRMRPTVDDIRRTAAIPMPRRGVVRAGIFGSFARGDASESSDIDFLVEFERGRTLLDLSGLRLNLCDAFGRDVDVATPGSLHPQLRERILRELVTIL